MSHHCWLPALLLFSCTSSGNITTITEDDPRPASELSERERIELCLEIADQLTSNQVCTLQAAALSSDTAACSAMEMGCLREPDQPFGCTAEVFDDCMVEAGDVNRCFNTLITNGNTASCSDAADTPVSAFASTECVLLTSQCLTENGGEK